MAEVLAALHAERGGQPLDRPGALAGDLRRVDAEHARQILVGHAPAQREIEHLAVPGIEAGEGFG